MIIATNGFRFVFCNLQNWKSQEQKVFEGQWGDWQPMVMCSQGFYVNGFNARVEPQAFFNDNTAFNGLQIQCMKPYTTLVEKKMVYEGVWGDWNGWKEAPLYELINSYKIRFQQKHSGDNTALNGLSLFSVGFASIVSAKLEYVIPDQYNLQPQAISTSYLLNNATTVLKQKVSFSNDKTFTQKWENSESYLQNYRLESSYRNRVPYIKVDADMIYTKEQNRNITFGNETSFTIKSAQELEVSVKPCSYFVVKQMIKKVELEIPYTLFLQFSTGHKQTVQGKYSGVLCSDIYTAISESEIEGCGNGMKNEEVSEINHIDKQKDDKDKPTVLRVGMIP